MLAASHNAQLANAPIPKTVLTRSMRNTTTTDDSSHTPHERQHCLEQQRPAASESSCSLQTVKPTAACRSRHPTVARSLSHN